MSKIPEALLSDKVPFEDHIADDVMLMRDGGVLAVFEVSGVFPDTADAIQVATCFDQLHGALTNVAAEDLELTIYQCRGEADASIYQSGLHRPGFAQDLDEAYRQNLLRSTLYSNRLFLAVQIHAPNATNKTVSWFLRDATTDPRAGINERMTRLNEVCELMRTQLGSFGLRRLGYVTRDRLLYDEMAEAIVFATTGKPRQIAATTGRVGNAMFSETIRFRSKRIEFHGAGDVEYGEMFAFREPPATCWPGMLHGLAVAPYRNTLAQSYRFLSNAAAMAAADSKSHKMKIANDKALSQMDALIVAADDIQSRRWVLGNHSLVVIAFAGNSRAMTDVSNATWRDLAGCGLVASRLNGTLQAGFLSMLPGGAFWRPRPGFISSRNLVAFAPFYNYPSGSQSAHWPGPPIATFRTMAGTPFQFHWHPPGSDVGATLFTGVPGSGKTVLAAHLLAMTAGRARVVALDHKRGWDLLINRMGGDYAVLGAGEPHFAPLKALDAAPHNIEFLTHLIRGCIAGTMTEEDGRRLAIGLSIVMTLPPEDRSLGEIRAFFDNEPEGSGVRLEKWCAGNELGWVIDAPVDTVNLSRLSGLDTTALLRNTRARGAALSYLFHRISLLLDGTPLLLPMDEAWRALLDDEFRDYIETQIRTIRSKNGVPVVITQSPRELIESGIAHVLIDMCPNQFHLANPRATRADYIDGMKLTEGQYEALLGLQGAQGLALLVQADKAVIVQLPLGGMDDFIRILSAREADLKRMDRIRLDGTNKDPFGTFRLEKEIAA